MVLKEIEFASVVKCEEFYHFFDISQFRDLVNFVLHCPISVESFRLQF